MQWAVQSDFEAIDFRLETRFYNRGFRERNLASPANNTSKIDTAFVLVVGLVSIPETDRKKLKNLKREQFGELIWNIKLNLLHAGVGYDGRSFSKDLDRDSFFRQDHLEFIQP
jgi:hypothetical protein